MKKINFKECLIVGCISGIVSIFLERIFHMNEILAFVLSLTVVETIYIMLKKNSSENKEEENGAM